MKKDFCSYYWIGLCWFTTCGSFKKIKVFGFDSNEKNISKIKKGHSYISDLTNKEVSSLKNENFL